MKRIRVTSNTGRSFIAIYMNGVITILGYGMEPMSYQDSEEEFDKVWCNPDSYMLDNEVYVI